MNLQLEIDTTHRLFRCKFAEFLSAESLRQFRAAASKLLAVHGPMIGVIDFTAVSSADLTAQDIRELAALPPVIQDRDFARFIVAPSATLYGLARMFELLGQETRPNLHVVRTAKEVWVILGIAEPQFELVKDQDGDRRGDDGGQSPKSGG
jgi:hypothetical protein